MKNDIHTPRPQVSTLSGELSLENPDPAKINLPDVITALRHQRRYGGHTTVPVSILQHSLHVWMLALCDGASFEDQRKALWHDAPEAYLLDIPRPLKKLLGETYARLEETFEVAVGGALRVALWEPPVGLRKWDTIALACECHLWRPPAAFADWTNLPTADDATKRLAEIAVRTADWPIEKLVYLDMLLENGRGYPVKQFLLKNGMVILAKAVRE